MAFPTARDALYGNPIAADHQPDKAVLRQYLEGLEALVGAGAIVGFADAVADLPDSGNTTGDLRIVTTDPTEDGGVYRWSGSAWVLAASLPSIYWDDAYARLSQDWAEGTLPGGAGTKSAKEHSEDAAGYADLTAADAGQTAADRAQTTLALAAAQTAAAEAEAAKNVSVMAVIAAGGTIVTALTTPVPADGTLEMLQTAAGLRLYEVIGGAWVDQGLILQLPWISAADYGASPAATWETNRDALQAANDAAVAQGGGVVKLPPGVLACAGVVQDSRVAFEGQVTMLVHPGSGNTTPIIASRVVETTGAIAAGSNVLTVADATGIEVGSRLAIRGAGGWLTEQYSSLNGAITDVQTAGITLLNTGSVYPIPGYIVVDNEVISYTGVTSGVLSGVTRGAAGTTAAAHGSASSVLARSYGGVAETQYTTLVAAITDVQTADIDITDRTAYASPGWLIAGTEIIAYTGISAQAGTVGRLTGVTRGALGTSAAAHDLGARIGLAVRHYATVTGVSGSTITLDARAANTVSGAAVSIGIIRPDLRGIAIDGNLTRPQMTFGAMPIDWQLVAEGEVEDVGTVNAESGFFLRRGSRRNTLTRVAAHNCGGPEASRGSSIWVYQGCCENIITAPRITGTAWTSIYLDDRTSTADEWMAGNDDNIIRDINIDVIRAGFAPAISITASNRNKLAAGLVRGAHVGLVIDDGTGQIYTSDGHKPHAAGNEVSLLHLDVLVPWTLPASGNALIGVTYGKRALSTGTNAGGNLLIGCSETPGGPPAFRPVAGTGGSGAPGYSFNGDSDTGLYSDAANVVGLAAGGTAALRAFATEARFYTNAFLIHATGYQQSLGYAGDPPAPAAGLVRRYSYLSGGKLYERVRFPNGHIVTIASEDGMAAVADATDEVDVVIRFNELLARLRDAGKLAT